MWTIKNKSLVPPGGRWVYVCPKTQTRIEAPHYPGITNKVKAFCEANGLPWSEASMDQVLCDHAHEDVCMGLPDGPSRPRARRLSFDDVLRGTKVLLALKMRGGKLVEKSTAEERASICAACPYNKDHEKRCPGVCHQLERLVVQIVGGEKTSKEGRLKNCQVCGCVNKAQVWVPYDILRTGVTAEMDQQWPSICWKKPKNNGN